MAGKSYKFYVTAEGNAKLVDDNGLELAQSGDDTKCTATVSFDASGGIIPAVALTNAKYAIRTNNVGGLEYMKDVAGNGQAVLSESARGAAATDGTYYNTSFEVGDYVHSSTAYTLKDPVVYLHDADKLVVEADQTAEA